MIIRMRMIDELIKRKYIYSLLDINKSYKMN